MPQNLTVRLNEKQLYLLAFILESRIGQEMETTIHDRNKARMIDMVELSQQLEAVPIPNTKLIAL